MTTTTAQILSTIIFLQLWKISVLGSFINDLPVPRPLSCSPFDKHSYYKTPTRRRRCATCFAAIGFGKDGSSSQKKVTTSPMASDKKKVQLQQRILQQYGGDIAKGTQERMDRYMAAQPQHIQLAAELYRKITRWDAYIMSLTVQQKQMIPPRDVDAAQQVKQELMLLYKTHGIDDIYMHNLFQKFTWDASADAKAARAITGQMPAAFQDRVNKACEWIGQSVRRIDGRKGRCLDVGCGYGVLVSSLLNSGVLTGQYVGVDLSSEMIRNARETYKGMNFISADFIKEFHDQSNLGFDGIIFCSSLHDLPDVSAALEKAISLLRPCGRIILVHPQGARHVLEQRKANPTMVRRALPDKAELERIASEWSLVLEHSPEDPYSKGEEQKGYLAVLSKPPSVLNNDTF